MEDQAEKPRNNRELMRWHLEGRGTLSARDVETLWGDGATHPKWYLLECLRLAGYAPKEWHVPSYREVQRMFIWVRDRRNRSPVPRAFLELMTLPKGG